MDRHIARTIVRNSAGDARVIWSIFSGYHPQELRESGAKLGIWMQQVLHLESAKRSIYWSKFSIMNGPSQYELQIRKNIEENKKVLASLGLDKFKVSHAAWSIDRRTCTHSVPTLPRLN